MIEGESKSIHHVSRRRSQILVCGTLSGYKDADPLIIPEQEFYAACERRASSSWTSIHLMSTSKRNASWLILPVVICLSQRLSHACGLILAREPEKWLSHPRKAAGRASSAITLKKLECSKQAYALDTLALDNIIGFLSYYVGLWDRSNDEQVQSETIIFHSQR
ncbi:Hypothetical predicted protein [Olea europaea subsp. europaea]|uniref:Uncharacterized protein n=1 Tax=Olea europaea subsp. europaea TaxID=158383 RepID=A0A8S0TE48_OLEEU|nr:Hypothetical predicted protein [Olea europaea subsp. europaea]